MQGRGYAFPLNLLRVPSNYEQNGITRGEADHMKLMHRSIGEMERILVQRGGETTT